LLGAQETRQEERRNKPDHIGKHLARQGNPPALGNANQISLK
jgi:hypothetical protein